MAKNSYYTFPRYSPPSRHVYLDHGSDCSNPGDCMFCDGGLRLCTTCGLAEGQLTTHCCGHRVDEETAEKCYGDEIDFVDGRWIELNRK